MPINTTTYKGHLYKGPLHTIDDLRAVVAELDDLPGDTPIWHAIDDANEPDSYELVPQVEIAFWDGEVQCKEGDEDARKAIFL